MRSARSWVALGAAGLAMSATTVAMGIPAATAASSHMRTNLRGSLSAAAMKSKPHGKVAAATRINFDLTLNLRNAAGARALVHAVSSPGLATYRHYLTDAQWEARFSPTAAQVNTAKSWLRHQGFTVGAVPSTRLYVSASGTAAQVEKAFSTGLGMYRVNGHTLRLATKTLSIPASIAGSVSGVVGVNEDINTNQLAKSSPNVARKNGPADAEPAPPAAFRNPHPCSGNSFGSTTDTTDSPSLYAPYTGNSYDICGYGPTKLRSGYGLQSQVNRGVDGSGVAIAIVDAYDSPTLLSDAQRYFNTNDPTHPLASGQFFNAEPATVGNEDACGASGWFAEQSLDVESSHAMAPGADILYVGAQDCFDPSLLAALQTAVTSGASVVSDSWGSTLGDLFEDADAKTAFDTTFMLADSTGVSVLFSSGDDGDNFADFGIDAPDYPPTSPFVTAVGGTSLEVNANNARMNEFGWSTGKQILCAGVATTNCGSSTTPSGALAFNAGGGGGTSYTYLQPSYQAGVVPTAISERNQALFGPTPLRVEPDISMDADAQTGMLIGLHQTFPDGSARYSQFKEGGTSLASPLLAGVVADADQVAGTSEGFLNPALYKAYRRNIAGAYNDIVPPANPLSASTIRVDYANTVDASNGYNVSIRTFDYQGPETNCDGTGNCETRNVTLTTAKGFDSMTGLGSPGPNFVDVLASF
jgi:subtilase family serine protease